MEQRIKDSVKRILSLRNDLYKGESGKVVPCHEVYVQGPWANGHIMVLVDIMYPEGKAVYTCYIHDGRLRVEFFHKRYDCLSAIPRHDAAATAMDLWRDIWAMLDGLYIE